MVTRSCHAICPFFSCKLAYLQRGAINGWLNAFVIAVTGILGREVRTTRYWGSVYTLTSCPCPSLIQVYLALAGLSVVQPDTVAATVLHIVRDVTQDDG